MTAPRTLVVVAVIASFTAGLAIGRRAGEGTKCAPCEGYEIRGGAQGYINPLLECELANEWFLAPLRPFGTRLEELASSLERQGQASVIAVYFRDLNNGPWVGRHEKTQFAPASLAKVPVVIACLRQAEADAGFLARTVLYQGLEEEQIPGFLSPEAPLERGRRYTVQELIEQVAKYSDNVAARLLAQALPPGLIEAVLFDLGIDPARYASDDFKLSPREYGAFFRVLYNASYLDKRLSALALEYFDRSTFELGLVAGVPAGTAVSHKFGVWESETPGQGPSRQLHDCGIVYHPQRPYLLCVMTAGDNYVRMAAAIAAISRFVYGEVDRAPALPRGSGVAP